MRYRSAARVALATLLLSTGHPSLLVAQEPLSIVSAGPTGELAALAQAAEIRVRFSEPMVTLGRLPDEVTAPFFAVRPSIAGTFRWAGPTILVFTPDPKIVLPNATAYEVTVAASAKAVSGKPLAQPYRFTFTTPTVRLLRTDWYRPNGRYDQVVKIALRFNQPVRPADVLAHATLRYQQHEWTAPSLSAAQQTRMGAPAVVAFDRKVAAARATTESGDPVTMVVAGDWDRTKYPPAPNLVVLESVGWPSTDGELLLRLDRSLPGVEGAATPREAQSYTIRLEHTQFVDNFHCEAQCDADAYNSARLRAPVDLQALRRATTIRDITDPFAAPVVVRPSDQPPSRFRPDTVFWFSLEDLGYDRQPPSRTYAITIDAGLQSIDGQVLGHAWTGIIENWHNRAFTSFGDGHGVWEKSGGTLLPFYARNYRNVTRWMAPVPLDRLMPTIRQLDDSGFRTAPPQNGRNQALGVKADAIQSHGLDLSSALQSSGTGLVWAAVMPGDTIAESRPFGGDTTRATIVQVTNLGISVKDSPLNTLVFVTRLDDGEPVSGADVSIVGLDNQTRWRGRTDDHGVAIAPDTRLRDPRRWYEFAFIVTASKDGDAAYVGSNWQEGVSPYEFGSRFDLSEAGSLLRGTVFADRGVYKLGEEVHVKAILRFDSAAGIDLLKAGTPVYVAIRDSRDKVVDTRTVTMNQWSTTEWTLTLPTEGALGNYQTIAALEKESLEADRAPARPSDNDDDPNWQPPWRKQVRGTFLVAAYRRPDFRVDATLGSPSPFAGEMLQGVVTARYLFGASMAKRPVSWTLTRTPVLSAPPAVGDKFPFDRFTFVGCCDGAARPQTERLTAQSEMLDEKGQLALDLASRSADGIPYEYTLEGDVEDVSRQHIANRAALLVHPASFYIGVRRPGFFVDQKQGLVTSVVAVSPSGVAVPGVPITVTLTEVQWHSVRRAEGNGFYTWETERKEVEAGTFEMTTGPEPVPLAIPIKSGGYFFVRATARDDQNRLASTGMSFYALGAGYTAWQRYDHNRIDLVPERQSYKPGDIARIMIQSPWESATALLTVEREGIRSHTPFKLTSTQQTVEVPITAADIPNIYVSVLLVKGRSRADASDDASDPGKPAFRLGYTMLAVEDATKRLKVTVKSNKDEFKPAGTAKVDVDVKDAAGIAAPSEVTLWAVDYGVLSLTAFRTPDVLGSVYVQKALQVLNTDNRQRIVSRRALTPKGTEDGGGGGADGPGGDLRKDFRVLAFWLGSVATDARGHASVDVKLPESLTTYRIMAVSGDRLSRFGSGESEIRINKPVVLKPAFPRFLTRGDKASFGSVVTSQLKTAGTAVVSMKSLDPAVMEVSGATRKTVPVPAGGSVEVRFDVIARGTGRARIQTTVSLGGEDDGFEESVPIEVLTPPESVAAYGEAAPDSKQTLTIPTGVVPGMGGLHLELSSTALVGLGEGARYVVEYPYGCVEQRASRVFVMAMAADLGDAFHLPGVDAKDLKPRVQTGLRELEAFQCPSGGFAFWPGACLTESPYLTSYVLHVYHQARSLKYDVNQDVLDRAYVYLDREMAAPPPTNEGWWPAYTAWEAFAVKVLADAGRNQDSNINRLYRYLDRMPVFAIAYLHDAIFSTQPSDQRLIELRRRMANAVLPEAGSSHVEELADPYLLYFWNSNVRSTSIVLDSLVRSGNGGADISAFVRWLMTARKSGRWGNTQENAIAMQALVGYYRKYESRVPNFTATIRSGTDELVRQTFRERSTEAVTRDIPMARLMATAQPGLDRDLTFRREGEGTLFYAARLTYTRDQQDLSSFDNGFHLERQYATLRDGRTLAPSSSFIAGDLIQVTISLDLPKERRYVAVTDPLPAGMEPVETWFATTAADINRGGADEGTSDERNDWISAWRRGSFDHVERHDDRVLMFATRLSEGHHEFTYVVRATTTGTFVTAPASAEEMYAPEISGRTGTRTVEVKP